MPMYGEWKCSANVRHWVLKDVDRLNRSEEDTVRTAREKWLREVVAHLREGASRQGPRRKDQTLMVLRELARLGTASPNRTQFSARDIKEAITPSKANVYHVLGYLESLNSVVKGPSTGLGRQRLAWSLRDEFEEPLLRLELTP